VLSVHIILIFGFPKFSKNDFFMQLYVLKTLLSVMTALDKNGLK